MVYHLSGEPVEGPDYVDCALMASPYSEFHDSEIKHGFSRLQQGATPGLSKIGKSSSCSVTTVVLFEYSTLNFGMPEGQHGRGH
jgi:hypothetical protein